LPNAATDAFYEMHPTCGAVFYSNDKITLDTSSNKVS